MSAQELIERVQKLSEASSPLDWRSIREQIHDEFDHAKTTTERIQLLALFTAVMNLVERNIGDDAETLTKFRNVRLGDYRLLITKECLVGENVCADTLYAVTAREIAAGRMAPDDSLRVLAEQQMSQPHPSRDELAAMIRKPKRTFLQRVFGN